MGKISDALEKYKKERAVKTEPLPLNKPATSRELEKNRPAPIDFVMPETYSPKLITLSSPDSLDAENFKVLRAQILFAKDRKRPRLIMVTSVFPGEGKTFVATNLAASIAQGVDEYVLLLDCDLRRSTAHKLFGFSNLVGLSEYLRGEKELSDLFLKTQIKKLSFIPAGRPSPNPSELLASNKMKTLLHEVKNRYDDRLVILDTAPSQVLAEANVLSQYVDGIIFVIRAQKTPREAIRKGIELIGKDKILGIVFNDYQQPFKSYGQYYKKYYN
ncbi:MAG: polysaccharide biosynthesis tyrosine autokinase [Deltaproteobacteria bacterium]|nr:polysaccharide biosynthesis tyrosine autokinase [Deltaproteobacteria bacterium]